MLTSSHGDVPNIADLIIEAMKEDPSEIMFGQVRTLLDYHFARNLGSGGE